jgi:hypothetical protein
MGGADHVDIGRLQACTESMCPVSNNTDSQFTPMSHSAGLSRLQVKPT